jgi:hypothetical protein
MNNHVMIKYLFSNQLLNVSENIIILILGIFF